MGEAPCPRAGTLGKAAYQLSHDAGKHEEKALKSDAAEFAAKIAFQRTAACCLSASLKKMIDPRNLANIFLGSRISIVTAMSGIAD